MTGSNDDKDPAEVDGLLAAATGAWDGRTAGEPTVRAAIELWTQAAASDPERVEGLIGVMRGQIWLTEHLDDPGEREAAALGAVQAGQWCDTIAPDSPECDYWLAVSIGVQARERRTTILDALPRMVRLLRQSIEGDPTQDRAGPHRTLGLVYLRAPGWPSGPGDPDLGLIEARQAVGTDPNWPPNQLCLAEALRETDDPEESRAAYRRALDLAQSGGDAAHPDAPSWIREARDALGD
jgi:hypothetical protein